jgi:ubiquitin conjugation factor E4 B
METQQALGVLEKLRDLIISYAGLTLQMPEMFPQPSGLVSTTTKFDFGH